MNYVLKSRVHKLNSFQNAWIKREDELSFGVSGSKYRKLSSFIDKCLENNIKLVHVFGGANSNSVLGTVQLLIENEIPYKIYIQRPFKEQGNYLFLKQFITSSNVVYVSNQDKIAFQENLKQNSDPKKEVILEEGASHPWSVSGASSLSIDLLHNEQELNILFNHVFLDSGTGFSAASFISHQVFYGHQKDRIYHITLVAGDEKYFLSQLCSVYKMLYSSKLDLSSVSIEFLSLKEGKSFGSTNSKVFQLIRETAKTQGFLLDPIYTAKAYSCFLEKHKAISSTENCLFVHSGGALTLCGFLDKLVE